MQDERILRLYQNRDEAAIKETADRYGAYCYSVAAAVLSSPEDCEECVNDTWLRAWNAIPPHKPKSLRMFLAKITRNLAFDRCKAAAAQKRNSEMTLVLEELSQCVTDGISPEDHVAAQQLGVAVNRFVRQLPRREADVFVRRYFFAETAAQIGDRYALSQGNVATILSRTRSKLRNYLKKEGYFCE